MCQSLRPDICQTPLLCSITVVKVSLDCLLGLGIFDLVICARSWKLKDWTNHFCAANSPWARHGVLIRRTRARMSETASLLAIGFHGTANPDSSSSTNRSCLAQYSLTIEAEVELITRATNENAVPLAGS